MPPLRIPLDNTLFLCLGEAGGGAQAASSSANWLDAMEDDGFDVDDEAYAETTIDSVRARKVCVCAHVYMCWIIIKLLTVFDTRPLCAQCIF